ncbi:MAG TPA: CAP domain-containing protein [Conexibacter sp.]|nr:CAP domain-containing protein [Conexibacter sp.]
MARRTSLALAVVIAFALLAVPAAALGRTHARAHHHRHPHRVVAACSSAHTTVHKGTIRLARDATLCLLNRVRTRYGLRPLRLNGKLSFVARRHSRDMVSRRYFAHDSLNGASPFQRMRAAHYVPRNASWWLGENIGWGSGPLAQPAALVRAWMHSPPHRANILSRHFRDIGIGIAPGAPVGGGGATYTTDFGEHS